jgi:predicted RNA-binding protein YlxR (DUF448 family)
MSGEPVRTCVGCRVRAPKSALLRIARTADGRVAPDVPAVLPGRGAYVHREADCVRLAVRRGALARALRTGLDQEELARLMNLIEEVVPQA